MSESPTKRDHMPALPEPKYIWHDDGSSEDLFVFADSGAVDEGCPHCERLFTADQLRAYALQYAEQRVREALQAAYDALFPIEGDKATLFDAQTAIRKLMDGATTNHQRQADESLLEEAMEALFSVSTVDDLAEYENLAGVSLKTIIDTTIAALRKRLGE